YAKEIPISDVDGTGQSGSGDVFTVRSTALALYDILTGMISNQDTLDRLALQIAQDLHDWMAFEQFDQLFTGVVVPVPNGLSDYSEVSQDEDAVVTRYRSHELNRFSTELQHNDGPNNALCKDDLGANPPVIVGKNPCFDVYDTLAAESSHLVG